MEQRLLFPRVESHPDPDRVFEVLDRDPGRRVVGVIERSGEPKHSIAARASGVAIEDCGNQLQRLLLASKVKASHSAKT